MEARKKEETGESQYQHQTKDRHRHHHFIIIGIIQQKHFQNIFAVKCLLLH